MCIQQQHDNNNNRKKEIEKPGRKFQAACELSRNLTLDLVVLLVDPLWFQLQTKGNYLATSWLPVYIPG